MSDSFASQLAAFRRQAMAHHGSIHRAVAIKLFTAVIMDTPVLSGRLRGNWRVSINTPDRSQAPEDPSGARTVGRVEAVLASSKTTDTLMLTNSLPYAARIEYDGWSHTKAPLGMVRRNALRFKSILRDTLALENTRQ